MQTGERPRAGAPGRNDEQQTATSEMLRIISDSPIQKVLDAVAENAARLCDSNDAVIYRVENNLLRLAARESIPVNRDFVAGRAAYDRRTVDVHNLAAEDSDYLQGSSYAKRQGHRTTLATPLLRERISIGVILVRRWEVRPFSDNQIALLETFADEAVIAIENVRLMPRSSACWRLRTQPEFAGERGEVPRHHEVQLGRHGVVESRGAVFQFTLPNS